MKPVQAILLTIAIFLLTSLVAVRIGGKQVPLIYFAVLGTAVWAAMDSKKIALERYRSGISYRPVVFLLLWIVAFPWYLIVRYRIKTGTAVLNEERTAVP